jgi:hypothetical protein
MPERKIKESVVALFESWWEGFSHNEEKSDLCAAEFSKQTALAGFMAGRQSLRPAQDPGHACGCAQHAQACTKKAYGGWIVCIDCLYCQGDK